MPIVIDFQCTVQFYRDHFERLHIPRPEKCPHCKAVDTFIGHGSYPRKALERREEYQIRIKRWLCKACHRTVSILPSFLLRHRHYLLAVIREVVTARFEEGASWGQIEQLGMSKDRDDLIPSARTIRRWCASFAAQAARWLAAVLQTLARHEITLPLLDPLGEVTAARAVAGALLYATTQFLAWAKTEWAHVATYGLNDRLRLLWHWGHGEGLGRLV